MGDFVEIVEMAARDGRTLRQSLRAFPCPRNISLFQSFGNESAALLAPLMLIL